MRIRARMLGARGRDVVGARVDHDDWQAIGAPRVGAAIVLHAWGPTSEEPVVLCADLRSVESAPDGTTVRLLLAGVPVEMQIARAEIEVEGDASPDEGDAA